MRLAWLIGLAAMAVPGIAQAHLRVGFGLSFGIGPAYVAPGYCGPRYVYAPATYCAPPPPVYVAPAPAYVPAPIYVAPPVVYAPPPPVYVAPPAVVVARAPFVSFGFGYGHHWEGRHFYGGRTRYFYRR